MKLEIERKFLVGDTSVLASAGEPERLKQGYLAVGGTSVRVRIGRDTAWLTVKGPTHDLTRMEYEYEVPQADAHDMLDHLAIGFPVEKDRYKLALDGFTWEIDVFVGANAPLVTAEVELTDAAADVPLPAWLGREISDDLRYSNAQLAVTPFQQWAEPC